MPIIEVEHLTKEFHLGQIESLKTSVLNVARRLMRKPLEKRNEFMALDDVSFSIDAGEVVGVIGHNGAGKSTLLKLISRITSPSSGRIKVNGRIAPLIEVGAGFVPDLTGRENVYLNGAILGLSRKDIERNFDEIVDFAEIEEFIDTPVKRYSSGMKVKLAFSVATSVESEILIVDEVLAVGDLAFQRKCFTRMQELISRSGRTVLLVSHNIRQVSRLCSRVLLLDHGRLILDDDPRVVTDSFYRISNQRIFENQRSSSFSSVRIESSGEAELLGVQILDAQGNPSDQVMSGESIRIRVQFRINVCLVRPEIVVGTHTTDFVYLDAGSTASINNRPDLAEGIHQVDYELSTYPLAAGAYSVRFALLDQNRRMIFSGESLCPFVVRSDTNAAFEPAARMLQLPTRWTLNGQELLDEKGMVRTA